MIPSRRLLGLLGGGLLVAALPVVAPWTFWIVVAGWCATFVALAADVAALIVVSPRASAAHPLALGVGGTVEVTLRVERRGRFPLAVTLRLEAEPPLEPGPDVPAMLGPGASLHGVALWAHRRGSGRVLAAWIRTDGPLGLLRRIDRLPLATPAIAVLPNLGRVRELAMQHFGAWQYRGGPRIERVQGDGSEFDALAPYQSGMDVRAVDWKASARHQALRVRRYRLERNQRLVVCLDAGRLMGDPIEGLERLDHGVHAALLLGYAALRAGDLVGLHAYAESPAVWVGPGRGVRHLQKLVQASATLRTSDVETNHVLGMHDLLMRLHRRSLIVVFTEFADSTTAELMVEYLGHAAGRHLVIFFALDDPLTDQAIDRAPRTTVDLARAVVGSMLRQDRQRVLRRLERAGVEVVHGAPGAAALRLLERYLQVKRRGLLG